jgi:hypothetical protein
LSQKVDECKPLVVGYGSGGDAEPRVLAMSRHQFLHGMFSSACGRGLLSSTFQLNLSRF